MDRAWGFETIELSPFYLNSDRLRYALYGLEDVRGKVFELGCGAGAFTRAIKKYRQDLSLVGSDIEKDLVELAKKIDKTNSYTKVDAHKIPFRDNSFNAVVAFDVIEHLKKPDLVFLEAFRILRKGGVLHASIPLEASPFVIHGLFSKIGINPKEKYAGHIKQFTKNDIVKMLKKAGFSKIKYNYSGHLFYQLIDFTYFLCLYLFNLKPSHTVEGYIEILPNDLLRYSLSRLKTLISLGSWCESRFLKNFPGQIGHFTAYKQ